MLHRLIDNVDNTVLLKQVPNVQKVSLSVVAIECLVFLVCYHCVLGVYSKFDVSQVYLIVPQVVVTWVDQSCKHLFTGMGHIHQKLQASVVRIQRVHRSCTPAPHQLVVLHFVYVFQPVVGHNAVKDIEIALLSDILELLLWNCILLLIVGYLVDSFHNVILSFYPVHHVIVRLRIDQLVHNSAIQFGAV